MIYLLCCRCANSEPRARTLLRENNYSKWQSAKAVKGKEQCLNFLDTLPFGQNNPEIGKLKLYIKRASSWSVLLGTDGAIYQWADIGSTLKEKLDAEILIRDFGNE